MSRKYFKTYIIFSAILVLLLSTTGLAQAGMAWADPPIPGTPLHVWFNPDEEGGTEYRIETQEKDEAVFFEVIVRNKVCEGTFDAGINDSDAAPGNWLMHETAECGKKIKFEGVWYDGQLYTEDQFRDLRDHHDDDRDKHDDGHREDDHD